MGIETKGLIQSGKKTLWKPILLLLVVALLLFIGRMSGIAEYLMRFKKWIVQLGPWGYLLFSLGFILLTVTAVPASVLTFLAGAFFGTMHGVILANICSTVTAALSFLIARYLAHNETRRLVEKRPRLKKLYDLSHRHEVMAVVLIRFIPLFPFNIINYGFGISPVSFRTYIFWSWLCMIPGTIVFVAGGDAIIEAILYDEIPLTSIMIVGVAFALVISSLLIVYRITMNYLQPK